MKTIEIDDDLYQYIAAQTLQIGESASDILRRLLPGAPLKTSTASLDSSPELSKAKSEEPVVPVATVSEPPKRTEKQGNIFDLVTPADLQAEHNIVGRFLYLLSVLARVHKKDFPNVLEIKGRNRLYFAKSAAELSESGSSTNPKQIPNTDFWVITNSNTTRKKMMLTETASKLGYSAEDAERIRDLL
ncbi:replication initiation negative regulator SeqA [Rheinheimera sp. UJ51]|uniref:replication initiation negative regulator SeqA n=1 Tax=Rheinheimera sp. UJ51 TaxID=2892446 RepID=UPI001E64DD25|nr:replication initiation negative regulator SeqA [Rheinheimera sp. UJ51]MCC5452014.1 replication initiation negative regulator SeqA [Rheinheimera sp. UJ51]